jgi:hypothetical protein
MVFRLIQELGGFPPALDSSNGNGPWGVTNKYEKLGWFLKLSGKVSTKFGGTSRKVLFEHQ